MFLSTYNPIHFLTLQDTLRLQHLDIESVASNVINLSTKPARRSLVLILCKDAVFSRAIPIPRESSSGHQRERTTSRKAF